MSETQGGTNNLEAAWIKDITCCTHGCLGVASRGDVRRVSLDEIFQYRRLDRLEGGRCG